MEAYSVDLRERILSACEAGEETRAEIAEQFGVSLSWIYTLLRRWRNTGSCLPSVGKRGRRPKISSESLERLRQLVRETPDATLEELRRKLRVRCSLSTMHNTLLRLGLSYKKRPSGPPNKIVPT